jgi:hypothetical protein
MNLKLQFENEHSCLKMCAREYEFEIRKHTQFLKIYSESEIAIRKQTQLP